MFKTLDGREHFYQWDSNIKLIVEDASITEVHFCNRTDSCSLVCETYKEDGLTLVNVPNILLQSDWKIHCYAFGDDKTKYDKCFEIKARTKPSDYVYTETEIKRYEDLEARIEALESGGGTDVGDLIARVDEVEERLTEGEKYHAIQKGESTLQGNWTAFGGQLSLVGGGAEYRVYNLNLSHEAIEATHLKNSGEYTSYRLPYEKLNDCISNTYTKAETDAAIANAIADITDGEAVSY